MKKKLIMLSKIHKRYPKKESIEQICNYPIPAFEQTKNKFNQIHEIRNCTCLIVWIVQSRR